MATVEHCIYCFEALSANLEKRSPVSLSQVQTSWTEYTKGLEESSAGLEDDPSEPLSLAFPRNPALERLSESRSPTSGSSTPASINSTSTSSLSPDTAATTPNSSNPSFVPVGLHPKQSSQHSEITESPLFVTWNTASSSEYKTLRGCIGTFEPLPLSTGLSTFALHSALDDHRFSPISLRELPALEVCVTLLTDFETCAHPLDWDVGVHGIRISFYAKNRRYGACYLPDVAVEQGWEKEETVVSAMRKGGWNGKREKWREVGDLKVTRFQGKAETVAWEEFEAWKKWVAAKS